MENSAYPASSLPSPALVLFSNTGGFIPEHLRMQRPFNPQGNDVKDLSVPFTTSGFGLRPLENYPGLPAHFLHMQHPFLTSGLEHRFPFAGSAFRPVTTGDDRGLKFTSPFLPQAKSHKLGLSDQDSRNPLSLFPLNMSRHAGSILGGYAMNGSENRSSPESMTSPGQVKEESSDAVSSEYVEKDRRTPVSDHVTDRNTPENSRDRKKRKFSSECLTCPVCGIRLSNLQAHLAQEVERLCHIYPYHSNGGGELTTSASKDRSGSNVTRWETYQRIKNNRLSRLRIKTKQRRGPDDALCPACHEKVSGTAKEVSSHVEHCVRQNGMHETEEEDGVINVGDNEEFWHIKRKYARFNSRGMFEPMKENIEEDLVVDDDGNIFGPLQYTDSHLPSPLLKPSDLDDQKNDPEDRESECRSPQSDHVNNNVNYPEDTESLKQVILSLKLRLRDTANVNKMVRDMFRCLICMDCYKKPVVSVSCWHVHCESCWLQTLGAKRLCPQCNMITAPGDLRRIYL